MQPDEIYNLAAQSHVAVSFEEPEYTANADALGTLRLLEAIRILGLEKKTRFYQASTSELYGLVQETPQKRDHAVLSALALRRGQALRLLDHGELPRGLRHVRLQRHPVQPRVADPRRDLRHAQDHARRWRASSSGLQDCLYLGNLDALRDWGHARDYVEVQWLMLQQPQPEDYVIATGEQHSVREFVDAAAARARPADRLEARRGRGGARDEQGLRRQGGAAVVAHRSALFPPDGGRDAARRRDQGAAEARLEAAASASASWSPRWCAQDLQPGRARAIWRGSTATRSYERHE